MESKNSVSALLNRQKCSPSIVIPCLLSPSLPVAESHGSSMQVKFSHWKGETEAETLPPQKQAV